jgi:hypothetical protein
MLEVKNLKTYLLKAKTLNTPQKAAPLSNIKRGIFINKWRYKEKESTLWVDS